MHNENIMCRITKSAMQDVLINIYFQIFNVKYKLNKIKR